MTLIIFLPSLLYSEKCGYLQGVVYNFPEKNIKTIVVYGKLVESAENGNIKYSVWENLDTVGYFYSSANTNFHFTPRKSDWISVGIEYDEVFIKDALSCSTSVPTEEQRLFIYDKNEFMKTELLTKTLDLGESHADCFRTLTQSLETMSVISCKNNNDNTSIFTFLEGLITMILFLVSLLLHYSTMAQPLLRFSALAIHFHQFLKNISWVLRTIIKDRKLNLKTGNFILALIADVFGGLIILHYIANVVSMEDVINFICDSSEGIVLSLRHLIEWLMGSPAGLKLNFPLNSVLGKFFIYHIDIWWAFLGVIRPVLDYSCNALLLIGQLGLSFQIAMLADFLAVASFHVYTIYVYAARLYNLQLKGLGSLSRLFIGCKRNPIPGKVDSCPYTTEQLFAGTIAFTILLFLLPTTFVYYVVFAAMRLAVVCFGGVLTRTKFLLQSLPIYVLVVWFINPILTASSVQIVPKPNSLVFYVQPICGSLWDTITACIPDSIERPLSVKWGLVVQNIFTGRLVYPV